MPNDAIPESNDDPKHENSWNAGRRKFLKTLGKAAIVTPPTMTVLLSTSLDSEAIAASGGKTKPQKHKIGFLARILRQFFRFFVRG
ncbi:hypothetical protein [Nitratireductor sp. ZSWI3]|uniref:hypothetical protein n=1 Tax=Nitratireductor sp. ZSWI3 TaxID=2966359 RepID=UPI00214FBE4B|nr:hypothetical protein [Nitratireductor sp. ZSWI3]MCR4267847.1 hypothetical protein [Nitratireductor sp. ZSWI3]